MMLLLLLSKMFYSVRLMFKTARMRKIRMVTLEEYISPTVSALHEQGLVQIRDISDGIQQDPELAELVTPSKVSPFTGKLSSLLMKTNAISELLGNSLSEGHGIKDTLKSFISPEIPIQKEVENLDTEALINKAEDIIAQVESETKVIEGKFSALDSETSVLNSNKSLANRLYSLDMDLALLSDSKYTSTTVGRIKAESASEIESNLSKLTDELDVFIVPTGDKETATIIVVALKELSEEVYSTLRKFDFERIEVNNVEGTPQQIISNADSRLATIESERNSAKADLRVIAERWDDDILSLKEELENEKEKNEILAAFVQTKDTYMLEAWVPVKDTEKVEQLVEKSTEGHCTFELIEIEGTDDEDVPVLQTNKGYVKPYEFLVDMYSPVRYNAVDPTVLVAIMFPFLFGYCLTDAFYGAIFAIVGVILVRGLGKIKPSMDAFGRIMITCGLWAIVLGLVTNGLLGDFPERIIGYRLPTVIPIIESFVHPEVILIIALAIGIIYTNIGFIIGTINDFRYDQVKDAIGSKICWFFLEGGIIFLAAGMLIPALGTIGMIIGAALIIVCLGMLVYANGLYGVMDVFGFLGNLISYARLLALCLSTGGMAMTINILTNLCVDIIPYIGIIVAVFIFIFGHIANFLVQILGAFINSLRLHYVEFFSQFFEAGKTKFNAFKSSRTFTKLKN